MRLYKPAILAAMIFSAMQGYAQTGTTPAEAKKADSLKALKADTLKSALKSVLNPGLPNVNQEAQQALRGEWQTLEGEKNKLVGQLGNKIKIFDKGAALKMGETNVNVGYNFITDTSGALSRNMNGFLDYSAGSAISFNNIPFNANINGVNTAYSFTNSDYSLENLYKVNFDPKKYREELQKRVLERISPDMVNKSISKKINKIKEDFENKLRTEITAIANSYAGSFKDSLQLPVDITQLSRADFSSLKTKLISQETMMEYREQLMVLQERALSVKDAKALAKDSVYQQALSKVERFKALEKVYDKVVGWKKRFDENRVVKELQSNLPFTKNNYKEFLQKPGNLESILSEHAELSGLQKLFMQMKKMDLGKNAVQSGDLSLQNVLNTGINTQFEGKKTSLGFIYGKNNAANNWLQSGLMNSVTNEYSSLAGINIGTGYSQSVKQSVALNFFDFNSQPNLQGTEQLSTPYLPVARQKVATLSLQSSFSLGEGHDVTVNVSRSFGSFSNNVYSDSSLGKQGAVNNFFGNGGADNYAVTGEYEGTFKENDIRVFVKRVGLGYNNPGNYMLRKGETQAGLGFARKFLGNKIAVSYSGDYRKQVFDPAKNYRYHAISNKLRASWRIARNDKVNLSYQRSDYQSSFAGRPSSGGSNIRLQADGSYRAIIAGKKIMNNLVVSQQRFNTPLLLPGEVYKNNMFMVNYVASTMVRTNLLSLSCLVTRSDQKEYFFNTSMLNIEGSFAKTTKSNLRISSTVGFYDNAGWNQQAGIKQTFGATLLKNIEVDFDLGYRKAVRVRRAGMDDQLFITSFVHYNF